MNSLDWAVWGNLGGWTPPPPKPDKDQKAVPWDEMKTKFVPRLLLDHTTWKPDVLDIGEGLTPQSVDAPGVTYGSWGYHLIRAPKHVPYDISQGANRGTSWFDGDTFIPALWQNKPRNVWMSIVPSEIFTCRPGVLRATKKVVVGGLGLGWMLDRIAAKKTVEELIVVEKSRELLDWYGEALVKKIGRKYDRLIHLEHGDVFAFARKHALSDGPKWRWVLDVWKGYGDSSGDPHLKDMRRSGFTHVWAWGESAYKNAYWR
jgi:hypothetical protein